MALEYQTQFWIPNARKTWTHWSKFSRHHQEVRGQEPSEERLRELDLFGLRRDGFEGDNQQPDTFYKEVINKMEPGFST